MELMRRRGFLAFSIASAACSCCGQGWAGAIVLPDPGKPITVPIGSGQMPTISPASMRSAASNAVQRFGSDFSTMGNAAKQISALEADQKKAEDQLNTLLGQRDFILSEFRRGLFCSQCRRSKSEIEATGEPFPAHLYRVNGHPIPATAEQIKEKEQEIDQTIAQLQREIERCKQEIQKQKDASATAWADAQMASAEWRAAVHCEQRLIGMQADAIQSRTEADLRHAQEALEKVRGQIAALRMNSPNSPDLAVFESVEQTWISFIDNAQLQANGDLAASWSEMRDAVNRKDADYDAMTVAIKSSGLVPSFLQDLSFSVSSNGLVKFTGSVGNPFNNLSLDVTPESAVARLRMSKVSFGISARETGPNDLVVGGIIQAFDYTANFDLGHTKWSDTGTVWNFEPRFSYGKLPKLPAPSVTIKPPEVPTKGPLLTLPGPRGPL